MNDYNRGGRGGGGGRRFGGGGGGGRRFDSGPREMHHAVCDECGNDCEVPFRPSGDKPIYCSSCFEKKDGGGSRRPDRGGSRPSFEKKDNSNIKLLDQMISLNSKMDRLLTVLEPKSVKKVEVKKEVKTIKEPKKATKKPSFKKVSKNKTKTSPKKTK